MNKPASKEPSMDEILSSIRQIIADDDVPDSDTPSAEKSEASAPEAAEAAADIEMMSAETEITEPVAEPIIEETDEVAPLELSPEQMIGENEEAAESTTAAGEFAALDSEPEPEVLLDTPEVPAVDMSLSEEVADEPATGSPLEMVIADDIAFDEVEDAAEPENSEPVSPMPDPMLSTDIAEKLLEPTTSAAVGHTFAKLGALSAIGGDDLTLDSIVREMLRPMLKEWLDENLPATVERMVEKEIERVSRGG